MHFWIDKRSSQLHQYGGGGRRGPAGAGGFYSQNFGTHRSSHHPPPSIVHHHPHRLRTRSNNASSSGTSSSSSSTAAGGATSSTNNNNSIHTLSSTNSNNNISQSPIIPIANGNPTSAANIALQYPHQQPHQVQQPSSGGLMSPVGAVYGANGSSGNLTAIHGGANTIRLLSAVRNPDGIPYRSTNTAYFNHPQQPGGILAISGSSNGVINAAALNNPPMAIVAADEEGGTLSSTTVLTFPPSATAAATATNPRGVDLSWRNPYHVPGSSVSRCRAYSRDFPLPGGPAAAGTSGRAARGRRTSSSSSSGLGRSSIGAGTPGTMAGVSINHSQNVTTPEGMTDRITERTSFDRDTVTPQRSLSLTSPEAAEQSSRGTSTGARPSLENDPGWACTKRVGLTLCFLAFILLGTVGAKFMIQGPAVIDGSRTGKPEAAAYFLFTELIFVAFAMFLFFTGVACLRKRTNDYLLRQFNQYILNSSASPGVAGGTMGGIPGQDAYDFEYYDGAHVPGGVPGGGSPSARGHHHNHHLHHNLHHGGFHHYRHHRSSGSLIEEGGDFGSITDLSHSPHNFHGAGPYHYPAHYGGGNGGGGSSRHGRSKPPPYDIAILLPLPDPEGLGGSLSPTHQHDSGGNINNEDGNTKSSGGKLTSSSDAIGFIDSSSVKDAQDAAGGNNVNYSGNSATNDNQDSSVRNSGNGRTNTNGEEENRSETPPPPYEQL